MAGLAITCGTDDGGVQVILALRILISESRQEPAPATSGYWTTREENDGMRRRVRARMDTGMSGVTAKGVDRWMVTNCASRYTIFASGYRYGLRVGVRTCFSTFRFPASSA